MRVAAGRQVVTTRRIGLTAALLVASACDGTRGGDEPVRLRAPIAVGRDLDAWAEATRAAVPGVMACAPVEEIAGAVLCLSRDHATMNRVFARLSLHAEGVFEHPRGVVARPDAPAVARVLEEAAGHDLSGAALHAFFVDVDRACPHDPALCLGRDERAFRDAVVAPMTRTAAAFAVIAAALEGPTAAAVPWRANLHHELLHGQYLLDRRHRDAVLAFWTARPESERRAVLDLLAPVYPVDDLELVGNELQAYLLQDGADGQLLAPVVPTLAAPLRAWLVERGVAPIVLGPAPGPR